MNETTIRHKECWENFGRLYEPVGLAILQGRIIHSGDKFWVYGHESTASGFNCASGWIHTTQHGTVKLSHCSWQKPDDKFSSGA